MTQGRWLVPALVLILLGQACAARRNAVVLLHHRKLRVRLRSLRALLPQWRALRNGNSLKNFWSIAGRLFR